MNFIFKIPNLINNDLSFENINIYDVKKIIIQDAFRFLKLILSFVFKYNIKKVLIQKGYRERLMGQ